LGLDHTKTVEINIAGKEVLPEFEVHELDKNLDTEVTMFTQMHANGDDEVEENDDFDDDDDEPAPPVIKSKKAAVAPKKETRETKQPESKTEKTELDGDDDDFIMAD